MGRKAIHGNSDDGFKLRDGHIVVPGGKSTLR